ncbi:12789_t:CDS:2, partial [Gigaspora rosea]
LQNVCLSTTTIETLMRQCIKLVKQKAGLAKGVPNLVIMNNDIYALQKIDQLQSTNHITIIMKVLQSPKFHKLPLKIRLQQLQNLAITPKSILEENPMFLTIEMQTNTAKQIMTLHQFGLQIANSVQQWPIPIKEEGQLLDTECNKETTWIEKYYERQTLHTAKRTEPIHEKKMVTRKNKMGYQVNKYHQKIHAKIDQILRTQGSRVPEGGKKNIIQRNPDTKREKKL